MTNFPNASRQVRHGADGPLVHLQSLDGRGMARLASLRTSGDGLLVDYCNVDLICGSVWVFDRDLMTSAPGAVFATFTQPMGGAHRSYLGLYDLDRCPDRAAAAQAWAQVQTIDPPERVPSSVRTTFADFSLDGAIAVGTGGRVVWVPVPQPDVDLNDHIAACLTGPDRLTGPVASQILPLADPSRETGSRAQTLFLSAPAMGKLLREWLDADAEGRIAELHQIAADTDHADVYAVTQVGPLSLALVPTPDGSPDVDSAAVMWASGVRGHSDAHLESRSVLAGCPFWTGPQDPVLAASYTSLRRSGLSPEEAATALAVVTAS